MNEEHWDWGSDELRLHFVHGADTAPRLLAVASAGEQVDTAAVRRSALPVLEIALAGDGRHGTAGKRHVDGAAAQRMRLTGKDSWCEGDLFRLRLDLAHPGDGLEVRVHYEIAAGIPAVRTWAEITATRCAVAVEFASSFAISGLGHGCRWEEAFALWRAANPWSGEFRWRRLSLADEGLYDVGMTTYGQVGSKNRIAATSVGAWSTSEMLPMGVLEDLRSGRMLAWQIEHSGAWHWELGDRYADVYLVASGPTEAEHQCTVHLRPGESFSTAAATVALADGLDELGAVFTWHRRRIRRPHPEHTELPIVYNDFLNALMSDPTTERVRPLIAAAADLGAEVYCIDAGWYDDEDGGWWDSVGEWLPSSKRFPDGGFGGLIAEIREAGMRPGLWLEPEVVGVRSPAARSLPEEAFFQRGGARVVEWGRYQFDLRHPAARRHLDDVIDRLMADFELAYFKFDYNIDIGASTDDGGGRALLDHGRAYLEWVCGVLDRFPGLIIEGCSAGGSRTDGATGAVFPVQSLTDQQDFRKMPPIAAAAPLAIAAEQAGVWASVDGSMTDEDLAFSMVTSLLARIHLTGRIDTLDTRQREVVREALDVYRNIRQVIPAGTPWWPTGLPGWRDGWVTQGTFSGDDCFLIVWRREGHGRAVIPLPERLGREPTVEVLYPRSQPGTFHRGVDSRGKPVLEVELPVGSGRLLRLRP